jgi:hypothetical protein
VDKKYSPHNFSGEEKTKYWECKGAGENYLGLVSVTTDPDEIGPIETDFCNPQGLKESRPFCCLFLCWKVRDT